MGFLSKLGLKNKNIKNFSSDKNDNITDNSYCERKTDRLFAVQMDSYLSIKNIYLIYESDYNFGKNIPQSDLILCSDGILKNNYLSLVEFNYGEYIKFVFFDDRKYNLNFKYSFCVFYGATVEQQIDFGINEICKAKIEEYYNRYNKLLHEKIVAFSIENRTIQELAYNAVSLCNDYELLDLESIKYLYFEHTCYYNTEDFLNNECYGNAANTIDGFIQNMAEILLEEIDEPEIALEHAAFEAFMRAYIEHFAEEFDKYIINECEENEVSDEIGDYRKYIKSAVEIIDFTNEDKLIIALTCKLFSLGLLEEHITLVDAYDIVINEIEIAEKNRNNNLIKDMLRGKKPIDRKKYTIDEVDLMDGYMFEDFICKLFEKMGYSAEVTQKTNDQGIDVIGKKNGRKLGIQAKCYSSKVGNSAIQEAVAGKNFYNCDSVMVITNNYFTEAAKALARANEVILWDRSMLSKKIDEFL